MENFLPKELLKEVLKMSRFVLILAGLQSSSVLQLMAFESAPNETVLNAENELIVSGLVKDSNGESLPGATVIEKGTSNGTTTNRDGEFTLSVNDGSATLIVSFVGFKEMEIPLNGRTSLEIILETDISTLEEVVVIGYGTQKRSDLTGSIASLSASDMRTGAFNQVDQQLAGKASGVQVIGVGGQPGDGMTIRIRGTNSILGNNEPLFVIDGIPYGSSIGAEINPNDIESIQILKDASATAIYGSRGANGVILITTKKGGGNPKATYETYYAQASLPTKIDVMNAEQLAQLHQMAIDNGVSMSYDPDTIVGPGTDWQDEIYRTAMVKSHQFSVSGGANNIRYLISGNYLDQAGIIIGTDYKRYGLRANLEADVNDKMTVGMNLYTSRAQKNLANDDSKQGASVQALYANPIFSVKDANGDYLITVEPNNQVSNPVGTALLDVVENNYDKVNSNFYLHYNILDNLVARVNFGLNTSDQKENRWYPVESANGVSTNGQAVVTTLNSRYWVSTNTLTYTQKINDDHSFDIMGGFQAEKTRTEKLEGTSNDFVTGYQQYHALQSGTFQFNSSSLNENALASFIGRFNYNAFDRYLLTFSGRYDGSSRFGSNNKWAFFPSGAFAWKLSNEPFMAAISNILSDAKVRVSYGVAGEQAIDNYQTLESLGAVVALYGGSAYKIGFAPNRLANRGLKWEQTAQLDLGLNARLEPLRLDITVDLYKKTTSNLLYQRSIPNSTGYSSILSNVGSIENKGLELTLSPTIIDREIKWIADFNIAFNRNKITDLGTGNDGLPIERVIGPSGGKGQIGFLPSQYALILGEHLGGVYGYEFEGVYNTLEEIAAGPDTTAALGDPKYRDLNGDGIVDGDDRRMISNPNPKFSGGFINTVRYKNFDMSIFFQFVYGNTIWNVDHFNHSTTDGTKNSRPKFLNSWTPENASSEIPRAGWDNRTNGVNTFSVEDGSYLRLRNITLGYNFSVKPTLISNIRIYGSLDNALTFTKYTGYNPDVTKYGSNSISGGVDQGVYPAARTFTFGLKVDF